MPETPPRPEPPPHPNHTPAPAAPHPPADPLLGRVKAWLADHDPGGVDLTRAFHLGVSFIIVIVAGYATSSAFRLGMDVTFPLMAGCAALVMISFNPAASVAAEARTMARLFGLGATFLLVIALVGPGTGHLNDVVQKLLLIPLSFCALALRRYGMDGQRAGLALIVVATVGTIIRPTRIEGALLLAAFCQGALVAAAVRLSPWRPSAVRAFVETTLDMQGAIATYLRELSEAVRGGRHFPEAANEALENLRGRVWSALAAAIAEDPGSQPDFERLRVRFYRLRVAVQLLSECVPEKAPDTPDWRHPFAAAADHIARRLEAVHISDVHAEERFERAVTQLRRVAFSPELPPDARFALMRALTAFDRLSLVVTGIAAAEMAPFPPPHDTVDAGDLPRPRPTPLLVPGPDGGRQLSAPLRVACQGAIATAITTALDLVVQLDHAYWATMTVMFVIGNSVGETYLRVRYRTVGTIIGVAIGMGLFLALGGHTWLLAAFCMGAQMIALVTQKDRYDVASAAVGLSVVLGLHLISDLGTEGMIARIYETAIGAVIALGISYLVLPVYLTDQLRPEVLALLRRCRAAFASWWPHQGPSASVSALVQDVRAMGTRLPNLGAEQVFGHSAGDAANIVSTLDVLITYLALLEDVALRLPTAEAGAREEVVALVEAARSRILTGFEVVLGEAPGGSADAAKPAVDAAVSTVLELADDPAVKELLPLVADYLAYSDAVLRPLRELRAALRDDAPWRKEDVIAAGRAPTPSSGAA
ncbi:FUSC family protein [Xanthobacter dioxanivorans]|uniref:FUSC family protein n=1 Tax=Xanthobacter dioxanivorans TaxID=2528964 RepID=A0A974PQ65_9HYPH|nr:FUSC family protein [Xanthobacter dioxanivorans]QRG07431.1 FUSC family protein [Xanthobacter dioxanivorans]